MQGRKVAAIGLAFASFLVALTFGLLTGLCGMMRAEPGGEPECVPSFYPLVPFWGGSAVVGLASLWFGRAWPALVLGVVGFGLGLLTGLGSGLYGLGCGLLLLVAGLVGRPRPSPPRRIPG